MALVEDQVRVEVLSRRTEVGSADKLTVGAGVEGVEGLPPPPPPPPQEAITNKEINAIVPVWDDEGANHPDFISDPDYKRRGFIVLK